MFPFILSILLLVNIGPATALALFGRQRHHDNTTSALEKRQGNQGNVLVTRFSTIFAGGDASQIRTAGPNFDIRVDLLNGLFGFCPTTVIAATDCGLAGICVDSFSCSEGCGFTDTPLTTFICSESSAAFCSTALLTLSPNVGPYSYIACGRGPSTDEYKAFTTKAEPSPTTRAQPKASSSSTTPPETDTPSKSTTEPAFPNNTNPPEPGSSSSSDDTDTNTNTNPEPKPTTNSPPSTTGAIIGGTFGCLALLCGCIVFIFWLRHRNRNAAAAAAKAASSDTSSGHGHIINPDPSPVPGFNPKSARGLEGLGVYPVAELSGRGVAAGGWQVGVGYAPMTPVELDGSGRR